MFQGLDPIGESIFIVGVTIGTGRKMEALLSRVIPGGGTSLSEDINEEDKEGSAEAAVVESCFVTVNLLAY
jgi:hypothetical protein